MSKTTGHITKWWTTTHEEEYKLSMRQKITNNYIIHSTTQTVYRTNNDNTQTMQYNTLQFSHFLIFFLLLQLQVSVSVRAFLEC